MAATAFPFDRQFQIGILALMTQRYDFLLTAVEAFEPSYFEDKILVWFFQTMKSHFQTYQDMPTVSPVLENELSKAARSGAIKSTEFLQYADVCKQLHARVNAQNYVINEVVRFCRRQAGRKVYLDTAPLMDTADDKAWDDIVEKIVQVTQIGSSYLDIGSDFFATARERVRIRATGDNKIIVPVGIMELDDKLAGGLKGGQLGLWMGGTGAGKCLQKGTLVLKYDGTRVPVELVKVGDFLMGPDSTPRKVLSLVNGQEELYRVTPTKGESWVCTYDHILTLVHSVTGVVVDVSVRDYLANSQKFRHCHKLFHAPGVDFPFQTEALPLDPYFLGVWLGDGTKSLGNARTPLPNVAITTADSEIHDLVYETAAKFGMSVRIEPSPCQGKANTLFITGRVWKGTGHSSLGGDGKWSNPLLDLLRETVGPRAEIPNQYLIASWENRSSLLAGLLDSDGYRDKSGYEIVQKREDYADAVCFLARSLGLCAVKRTKVVSGVVYYRVTVSGDTTLLPMRVAHKLPVPRLQEKNCLRTGIASITPVGVSDYYGFTLDGDCRFLLGDFTVTHNSIALCHCGNAAAIRGFKVVHYTLELDEIDVGDRYDSLCTQIPINELKTSSIAVLRELEFYSHQVALRGGRLLVKSYPTGTASVNTLRTHLKQLEATGWRPDLIIVDYLDLLKPLTNYQDEYADLGSIAKDLRGLAGDLQIPVWSATQGNRSGMQMEVMDIEHISDSLKKAQIADVLLAMCANREERAMDVIRIFGAKNRNGPAKFVIQLNSAYKRMTLHDVARATVPALAAAATATPPPSMPPSVQGRRRRTPSGPSTNP